MNWSVDWVPGCEQELADLWLNADDRNAVTRAAHRIDQRLQANPENEGESRPNNRRITFEAPLGVVYRVLPDNRLVQVLHVWKFRT